MANVKYLDNIGTQALITEMKTRLAGKAAQYSTMPTAAVGLVGQIVQYIGTTGAYTQGDFYICGVVADSDPAEYEWVKLTYNKTEVDELVAAAGHFEAVDELPSADIKTNVIYLVPKTEVLTGLMETNGSALFVTEDGRYYDMYWGDPAKPFVYNTTLDTEDGGTYAFLEFPEGSHEVVVRSAQNVKIEYINLDGTSAGWEKIGDTELDLSAYVQFSDLTAITAAELADMWDNS